MSIKADVAPKLSKIKELFTDLLEILKAEGDNNVNYAINELSVNIDRIEHTLDNVQFEKIDVNLLFNEVKKSYNSMYPPRGGLADFFVWREDFNERVKANETLDKIKEELHGIFNVL